MMLKLTTDQEIITIPNIIDEAEVWDLASSDVVKEFKADIFNIVTVARLEKPKTLNLALEAAYILKRQGSIFHWYIIGEGSERSSLEKYIVDKDLNPFVTLLGYKDNPYPYIKKSNLYVQTSEFEGLGRTLIEATILNKTIVTTNFPTAYSIVKHKETGLIVSKKAEEIAKAISTLLENKNSDLTGTYNNNYSATKIIELVKIAINS